MKEFFEVSNIEELVERIFAHIKTQVENDKQCFKWTIIAALHHERIATNFFQLLYLQSDFLSLAYFTVANLVQHPDPL